MIEKKALDPQFVNRRKSDDLCAEGHGHTFALVLNSKVSHEK